MITIERINSLYVRLTSDKGTLREIAENFRFFVPHARYDPLYKNGVWDGYIKLFNTFDRKFYFGLIPELLRFAKRRGYEVKKVGSLQHTLFDEKHFRNILHTHKFDTSGKYRYQEEAAVSALKQNKAIVLSPTGSGKSSIIYLIVRYLFDTIEGNILICVPTVSLTKQLMKDVISYVNDGFKIETQISLLYSGQVVDLSKKIIIGTFQSIRNQGPAFFSAFEEGAFICDEVHTAENSSINGIIERLPDVKYRIGFTGTLKDTKCHIMKLKGLFGPVFETLKTKDLMENGVLSKLKIRVVTLQYPLPEVESFCVCVKSDNAAKDYHKEMTWLSGHKKRNDFIINQAMQLSGNTLILFNYKKHGKELYRIATNHSNERPVFFIDGDTPVNERELIRERTESLDGVIIVASSAVFSTGINIKKLTNLILAHSFKAKIRNLQSIGRTLRLHNEKDHALLIDISDNLAFRGKKNLSLKHQKERLEIYKKESFDFDEIKVPL